MKVNWKARVQAWATLLAALSLPVLYIGGTQDIPALSVAGLTVFAGSLLACPALRFIRPPRDNGERPRAAAAAT